MDGNFNQDFELHQRGSYTSFLADTWQTVWLVVFACHRTSEHHLGYDIQGRLLQILDREKGR